MQSEIGLTAANIHDLVHKGTPILFYNAHDEQWNK